MADVVDFEIQFRSVGDERAITQTGKLQGALRSTKLDIISINQAFDLLSRGVSVVVGAFGSSIDAAKESQREIALFNQALTSSGQFSVGYSRALQAIAGDLQDVTTFSDEMILSVERQLVPLGLTTDQMADLAETVLDLSIKTGQGADEIARMIGRSDFENLRRLGIVVDKNASSQEKFNQVLARGAQLAGGSARTDALTYGGAQQQLANAFDELEEAWGNVIVQGEAWPTILHDIRDSLKDATEAQREWNDANRESTDQRVLAFYRDFKETLHDVFYGREGGFMPSIIATIDELDRLEDAWQNVTDAVRGYLGQLPTGGGRFGGTGAGGSFDERDLGPVGRTPLGPVQQDNQFALDLFDAPAAARRRSGLSDNDAEGTKKLNDELAKLGRTLTEDVRTPFEGYNADLAEYQQLLDAGQISQQTFTRAVEASAEAHFHGSEALARETAATRELEQAQQALRDEAQSVREVVHPELGLEREIARIKTLQTLGGLGDTDANLAIQKSIDDFRDLGDVGEDSMQRLIDATERFGDRITDTIAGAVSGARFELEDLGRAVVFDLTKFALTETVTRPGFEALGNLISPRRRTPSSDDTFQTDPLAQLNHDAAAAGNTLVETANDAAAGFDRLVDGVGSGFNGLFNSLSNGLGAILSGAIFGSSGGDDFLSGLGKAIGGGALSGAVGSIGSSLTNSSNTYTDDYGTKFRKYHDGGWVGGSGVASDEELAILKHGERVLSRDEVQDMVELLGRSGGIRRYHDGGYVGGGRSATPANVDQWMGQQGGDTTVVHTPIVIQVQSLDPRGAAAVVGEQMPMIIGRVNREIERGQQTAKAVRRRR